MPARLLALPVKPRVNAWRDRALFAAAFGIGTVVLLALKMLGAHPLVTLSAALAAMALYALPVMFVPRFHLREDRAGDSFYYMGLLFTLVSLSHTLWAFADARQDSTDIISGFGVALGTTIAGLMMRVVFQQYRTDPFEVESVARNELVESANSLSRTLHAIVLDMDTFHGQAQRVMNESMTASADGSAEVFKRFSANADRLIEMSGHTVSAVASRASEQLSTAADASIRAIQEATRRFTTETERIIGRVDGLFGVYAGNADRLAEGAGRTVAAIEQLRARVAAIEPPVDLVQQVFGPARDGMREAANEIHATARAQTAQVDRLQSAVETALKGLPLLDEKIRTVESTIDRFATVAESVRKFGTEIGAVTANLERLVASLAGSVAAHGAAATAIGEAAAGAGRAWDTAAVAATRRESEATRVLADSATRLAAALDAHIEELNAQSARARAASSEVVDGLTSMVEELTRRLR